MLSRDEVTKIVRDAVAETFAIEEELITNDNLTFEEDLQADSLGMMSLAMVLEDEFGAEIEADQVGEFITIKNVIDYVVNRQEQEAA
jgi:acyl carrier protein